MKLPRFRRKRNSKPRSKARAAKRFGLRRHCFESLEERYLLTLPTLAPIADVAVLPGKPLYVALNGADADGDALTFSATSDNGSFSAQVPQGNRSMRISVQDHGNMVLELFEQRVPITTGRIIELAEGEYYDGLIFHRIIEDFMIQGGSSDGFGTAGSGVTFDDEFHPDLVHSRKGVLSMANSGPNTNDSQFFITAAPTPSLDSTYNMFGFQTKGDNVRASIAGVPTGANDRPLTDVVMTSVDIITDTLNGVLILSVPEGYIGEADVTVSASDGQGGIAERTFHVTSLVPPEEWAEADTITASMDAPSTVTLPPVDVGEVDVTYTGTVYDGLEGWENLQLSVRPSDGRVTVTPTNGLVGVQWANMTATLAGGSQVWSQYVPVHISPAAPGSVDLLASADTGISDSDGITRLNNSAGNTLSFRVSGVAVAPENPNPEDNPARTVVTLFADGVAIGSGVATSDSVIVHTNGSHVLTDGDHAITAVQTLRDLTVLSPTVDLASEASQPMQITVDSSGPQITSQPVLDVAAGELYTYDVQTDDETAGAEVSYRLAAAPAGMLIDQATGIITWTPQIDQGPAEEIVVVASDLAGNEDSQDFNLIMGDLPHIDFWLLPGEVVENEYRYAFQTVRQGRLTVEVLFSHQQGDLDLTLRAADGTELELSQTQTDNERVDRLAEAGQTFELVVTGNHPDATFRVTNMLQDRPGGMGVYGTEGDDTFEIRTGQSPIVTVNGVVYDQFDAEAGRIIEVTGRGGEDTGTIFGTQADDVATLSPGSAELAGGLYRVSMGGVASIIVNGIEGNDRALFHDSPGDDELVANSRGATLSGDGFRIQAKRFVTVEVIASEGGLDVAKVFDSDGDDSFVGMPTYAGLSGDGRLIQMRYFDAVHAYSGGGGTDRVKFYDSPGNDTLAASPGEVAMFGDGFFNRAKGFASVNSYATMGGTDLAKLFDSPGDDLFFGGPIEAALLGDGFYNRVKSFEQVEGYSTAGGNDEARLFDSPGDDLLIASPGHAEMTGDEFSVVVDSFKTVTGFANVGGHDTAQLAGSDGDDLFSGSLSGGNLSAAGFVTFAKAFDVVEVEAGDGFDVAKLYDSSENDTFDASPDVVLGIRAELSNSSASVAIAGFDQVNAFATAGGNDVATLHDSPGNDVFGSGPKEAALFGDGFFVRAKFFERVDGIADGGGHDVARMYDSPSSDSFSGGPGSSTMSNNNADLLEDRFYNRAESFEEVIGNATPGGIEVAFLTDSPGDDELVAGPGYAKMSGDGYSVRVNSFFGISATAEAGGRDVAKLFDSPGNDAFIGNPGRVEFQGMGMSFIYTVVGFGGVHAYATAGGHDIARLSGSPENDSLRGTPDEVALYNSAYYNRAKYFEEVYADAGEGDDDRALLLDSDGVTPSDTIDLLEARVDLDVPQNNWARLSNESLDFLYQVMAFEYVKAVATTEGDTMNTPPLEDLLFTLDPQGTWQ